MVRGLSPYREALFRPDIMILNSCVFRDAKSAQECSGVHETGMRWVTSIRFMAYFRK